MKPSTSKHFKALLCSNSAICLAAANDSRAGSGTFKMWLLTFHLRIYCCVGECYGVSHCTVGSCIVSDYIKSINTPAPFLRRMVPCNWLFQWLWFRRATQELLCLHQYGNDVRGVSVSQCCINPSKDKCYYESVWIEAAYLFLSVLIFFFFSSLQAVKLSHWALLRDSIYYTFSITALIVVRGYTCKY